VGKDGKIGFKSLVIIALEAVETVENSKPLENTGKNPMFAPCGRWKTGGKRWGAFVESAQGETPFFALSCKTALTRRVGLAFLRFFTAKIFHTPWKTLSAPPKNAGRSAFPQW
jgi:hypothetical protein